MRACEYDVWIWCKACSLSRDLLRKWTTYTIQETEAVGVGLWVGAGPLLSSPLFGGRLWHRWVLEQGGFGQVPQGPSQAGHLCLTGRQVRLQLRHQEGLVIQDA